MPSRVVHFEIVTKDPDALSDFYHQTFDWTIDAFTGGGANIPKYLMARPDGETYPKIGINGGIGALPDNGYEGHVTFYISVDDIEATLQKIERSGGKRMMGPSKVPNGPTIGLFEDPQGHTVGLVQVDEM